MTAVLYAVRPEAGYFKLSEPGTISVLSDGSTKFSASMGGKHRFLIADPSQKETIIKTYIEIASAKPVPRQSRRRQQQQEQEQKQQQQKPPEPPKPPEVKPPTPESSALITCFLIYRKSGPPELTSLGTAHSVMHLDGRSARRTSSRGSQQ
jgi:hypothetical protein